MQLSLAGRIAFQMDKTALAFKMLMGAYPKCSKTKLFCAIIACCLLVIALKEELTGQHTRFYKF